MMIRYRSERCAFIHIQRKQIRVHVSCHGWVPGLAVLPNTNLEDPRFSKDLIERFRSVFERIDVGVHP